MLFRLFLAFTVIPFVELALLIELGRRLGTMPTIALVLLTGAAGAYLARWQGIWVLNRIRSELDRGRMPARELLDGLLILIGAALLLTPGLLTDTAGVLLLLPSTRHVIRAWVEGRLRCYLETGRWWVY